jgi:hypothetical protein
MDKQLFDQVGQQLYQALEQIRQDCEERDCKRMASLWKPVELPRSLDSALQSLTKSELDSIRQTLNIKNISSLPKQQLIQALSQAIPRHILRQVRLFDHQRYALVSRILAAGGCLNATEAGLDQIEYYRSRGLFFTGVYQGQKVFFMPAEVLAALSSLDKAEMSSLTKRNTQWIRLTTGLLYYYGVLGFKKLDDMLTRLLGQKPDSVPFIEVISQAICYGADFDLADRGYCHVSVDDADKVYREQQTRQDVDYRQFTSEQLFKAGQTDYIDETPELRALLNLLRANYEITAAELNEIALDCQDIINNAERPLALVDYFKERFEFPSLATVEQLMQHVMELQNNTRQWVLKGHTPMELSGQERKSLRPLPVQPILPQSFPDNVFDISTGKKIGRNDPCPCGSGQKYKKCCGK